MCALTGSSTRTSGRSAGPSPRISCTASPIMRTYRSNPTPAMCPDCSPPSRLPAPRISRSFIATNMPALPAPADPAAQLVQLREPVRVGPVHDQRVGVRYVQAGLDDRGADEHVG